MTKLQGQSCQSFGWQQVSCGGNEDGFSCVARCCGFWWKRKRSRSDVFSTKPLCQGILWPHLHKKLCTPTLTKVYVSVWGKLWSPACFPRQSCSYSGDLCQREPGRLNKTAPELWFNEQMISSESLEPVNRWMWMSSDSFCEPFIIASSFSEPPDSRLTPINSRKPGGAVW